MIISNFSPLSSSQKPHMRLQFSPDLCVRREKKWQKGFIKLKAFYVNNFCIIVNFLEKIECFFFSNLSWILRSAQSIFGLILPISHRSPSRENDKVLRSFSRVRRGKKKKLRFLQCAAHFTRPLILLNKLWRVNPRNAFLQCFYSFGNSRLGALWIGANVGDGLSSGIRHCLRLKTSKLLIISRQSLPCFPSHPLTFSFHSPRTWYWRQ